MHTNVMHPCFQVQCIMMRLFHYLATNCSWMRQIIDKDNSANVYLIINTRVIRVLQQRSSGKSTKSSAA